MSKKLCVSIFLFLISLIGILLFCVKQTSADLKSFKNIRLTCVETCFFDESTGKVYTYTSNFKFKGVWQIDELGKDLQRVK